MGNRWAGFVAPGTGTQTVSLLEAAHPESPPVLRGAQAPQQGVSAPDGDRRLERFPTSSAGPYWLGAHGGAGRPHSGSCWAVSNAITVGLLRPQRHRLLSLSFSPDRRMAGWKQLDVPPRTGPPGNTRR